MKSCEEIQQALSQWLDGESPKDERQSIEEHLADCESCRQAAAELRQLDMQMIAAAGPARDDSEQLADRVNRESRTLFPTKPNTSRSSMPFWSNASWWLTLCAAASIGYAIAVVAPPWPRNGPHVTSIPVPPPVPATMAHIVAATGDIRVQQGAGEWVTVPQAELTGYQCASDTAVATGPGVRCEIVTRDGAVVRMNDRTTMTLRTSDQLELDRGQVWCNSPKDKQLAVVAKAPVNASAAPSWTCDADSAHLASIGDRGMRVVAATGSTKVQTPQGELILQGGEAVSIEGSELKKTVEENPLLQAGWIHPLLILKGRDNPELGKRVDALLAQIGFTKVSNLYENEIRSLGVHSTLPLLKFVQSKPDAVDQRRRRAMAILADIAPPQVVGELIPLLGDEDPQIRTTVATTLLRLTGLDHQRSPTQWRAPLKECAPTIERWEAWWTQHRFKYEP